MLSLFRHFAFSLLLISVASFSQQVEINEQELDYEILDIVLKDKALYQSAEFFRTSDGQILAPLQLFEALLEINLTYNPDTKQFIGSFSDIEVNTSLDELSSNISTPVYWSKTSLGYYFDLQIMDELIQSELVVNYNDLTLAILPNSKSFRFPIETRLERESRQLTNLPDSGIQYNFLVEDQYRLSTPPKGQVSLALTQTESDTTLNTNLSLYGDALYHAASLNININSETSDVLGRLKFSRDQISPNKKIFGVLNNYSFGDVSNTQTRFGIPVSGLGVSFSTIDKRFNNYYGKATIEEDVPANWEAELYKYGYLIGITTATDDGKIIYQDLDVDYGTNRFTLKLYGPFGETETRNVDIIVGNQIIKQGNIDFSVNLVDQNKSVFNSNNPNTDSDFNPTINIQTNLGLGNKTSIGLGYLSEVLPNNDTIFTDSDDTNKEQLILSVSKSLSNSLLDISAIFNDDDKYDYNMNLIGATGQYGRYRLSAKSNKTETTTNYSIGTYYFTRFNKFSFSISSDLQQREFVDQTLDLQSHQLTIATPFFGTNLSNSLNYTNSRTDTTNSDSVNGQLSVTKAFTPLVSSRFSLDYLIKSANLEDPGVQSASFNTSWRTLNQMNGSFNVKLYDNKEYEITNQLAWRTKKLNLTSNLTYSSEDSWSVGIGITFNLDYDYYKNKLNLQSEYSARSSTLDLFTYEDRNKSGHFDEFDSSLSNVRFGPAPYWYDLTTNENGYTYLPNANVSRPFKITYDTSDTKSDLLSPVYDLVHFYTHAGGVTSFDVPFNYTSYIDGSIVNLSDKVVPNNIPMQLLTIRDKVIKQFNSDFNNNYSLEDIWPGKYKVRISPEYLDKLELVSLPKEHLVDLKTGTNFIQLPDFELVDKNSKKDIEEFEVADNNFYTIQFGVYDNKEYCALRVAQLQQSGFSGAFYSLATNTCKVFIGEFDSKIDAEQYRKSIPKQVLRDAFTTVYREGDKVYSIQVSSYSIQLSAIKKDEQCNKLSFKNIADKLDGVYIVSADLYCKLYLGDFASSTAAKDALNTLPDKFKKGAFLVKR